MKCVLQNIDQLKREQNPNKAVSCRAHSRCHVQILTDKKENSLPVFLLCELVLEIDNCRLGLF